MFISQENLDDALHELLTAVLNKGARVSSTKGDNIELLGVLIEIQNPRSRLSLTETRGKPFSCVGELLWYLSGSDKLDFIEYYIPTYRNYVEEDGTISGAYGPRVFSPCGNNQFQNVLDLLKRKSTSRQAVIQIFSSNDIATQRKDTPCTCTLQFFVREKQLNIVVCMRSNDAYLGFPHDVFAFSMVQEIMASALGLDLGTYQHFAGSMHIYDEHISDVKQFINEGYQSTLSPMPSMPAEDAMPAIQTLLDIESALRTNGDLSIVSTELQSLPEYWQDIARLLQAYRCYKSNDLDALRKVRSEFNSDVFELFVDRKVESLQDKLNKASVATFLTAREKKDA
jgi:thymidylate synthase